ncbi:MAG: hypothetical protein WAV30_02650 [Microgenomates group bacterium]
MMKKNKQLVRRMNELRIVEPNDLGIPLLTHIYRKLNGFFKTAPFLFIVPLSLFGALALVLVFGYVAVKLASLLQYGF